MACKFVLSLKDIIVRIYTLVNHNESIGNIIIFLFRDWRKSENFSKTNKKFQLTLLIN